MPRLRVLESGLKKGVGAKTKGVFEGEMGSEGGQALPQRPHAFRANHRHPAVGNPSVLPRPIELKPSLNHVDGLEAARLDDAAERSRHRLHVWRDRLLPPASCPYHRRGLEGGGGSGSGAGGGRRSAVLAECHRE